jgi:RHS repeat-associated protein
VADGEHVITALVDYSGQPDVVLDASFTVENGGTSAPVLWVSTGDEQHPTTDTTAVADTTTTSAGAVTDDEDEGGGLSMLGGGGWARSWYHHGGIHIGLRTDGVLTYTFGDHLGTVATTRQWFLPYGTPRAGSADTDIGFTAQRLLPQGLIDLRARQYDPVTGRFTQPDTIIPDPANLTDPTGHIPTPAHDGTCHTGACSHNPNQGDTRNGFGVNLSLSNQQIYTGAEAALTQQGSSPTSPTVPSTGPASAGQPAPAPLNSPASPTPTAALKDPPPTAAGPSSASSPRVKPQLGLAMMQFRFAELKFASGCSDPYGGSDMPK